MLYGRHDRSRDIFVLQVVNLLVGQLGAFALLVPGVMRSMQYLLQLVLAMDLRQYYPVSSPKSSGRQDVSVHAVTAMKYLTGSVVGCHPWDCCYS